MQRDEVIIQLVDQIRKDNKDFYNAIYTLVRDQSKIIAKQAETIERLSNQVSAIGQNTAPTGPSMGSVPQPSQLNPNPFEMDPSKQLR